MKIPKAPPGKKFIKIVATMLFEIDEEPKGIPNGMDIQSVMNAICPEQVGGGFRGLYMGGECKIEVVMKKGKA